MKATLVMFRTDGTRRDFPLANQITLLGRATHADLQVPLPEVSREHCQILVGYDAVSVHDQGSSNGTYHNGKRVKHATLNPGDQLAIGPVVFTLSVDGQPANIDPVPLLLEGHPAPEPKPQDTQDTTETPELEIPSPAYAPEETAQQTPEEDNNLIELDNEQGLLALELEPATAAVAQAIPQAAHALEDHVQVEIAQPSQDIQDIEEHDDLFDMGDLLNPNISQDTAAALDALKIPDQDLTAQDFDFFDDEQDED